VDLGCLLEMTAIQENAYDLFADPGDYCWKFAS
jgi:hypothetical protein